MTIKSKIIRKGVKVQPTTSPATEEGEIRNDSADNKFKGYTEGAEREIVTADQAQTLENKTIDSASNTMVVNADEAAVSELEVDNLKAGVLDTDGTLSAATDAKIPSSQAVKTYVDSQVASKDEASEISYDNTTSGLTATDVQAAVDEVENRLDTAETNISNNATGLSDHLADAVDAHDASAISNAPSGNLAATDVQSALNELQSDVDTRALDADLTAHLNDAVDAHDASAVSFDNVASGLTATTAQAAIDEVEGRLDTAEADVVTAQATADNHIADAADAHAASAITNTPSGNLAATDVQAALNELQSDVDTRALDADLTSHVSATAAHGTTGDVVGTTDTQTLENKTIDGAIITAPAQLDVKQDTLANLTTYATTATNGQIVFATDTKQMFQVIDASLTAIGGGGGGTSFDENQVAHGLAVLDAIYHNGTSWVKAQANDAATLATHIVSAVVDVDNFTAQNFGRFEATAHGQTVGEFYFLSESVAGGSDTVEGSVYSAPLYYVEDVDTIHALVYRPSLRPQNTQFREDVDVLENILEFDTTSAGFTTETEINGESFRLTHDASVTRFAEVDLAVTPKFRDKILELPVDLKSTATSGNFKVVITDQTNSKTLADEVLQPQDGSETVKRVVSFSTKPVDGDLAIETIRVRFEALAESGAVSDFDDVLVQLKKTQSLEVIAIEQEENVFSARIANNGTASITSQSSSFISSVNRDSLGLVTITFKSGFFTEVPSVSACDDSPASAVVASPLNPPTVNSVTIDTYNTAAAAQQDRDFTITVTRQGSDYRNLERRVEQEISTFNEVLVEEADSMVRLTVAGSGTAGYGSTNTAIRRFQNLEENLGSAIRYTDSVTEGTSFEILEDGIYSMSFSMSGDSAYQLGFSKNSTQLSTDILSINPEDRLTHATEEEVGQDRACSWTGYLKAGDIVRPHGSNAESVTVRNPRSQCTITKQGALKKASVAPDSKIKIPTSELKMRGISSLGTGTESRVVQFSNIDNIVGDAFSVDSSNGTSITIKKEGLLNVRADANLAAGGTIYITVNNPDRTVASPSGSFVYAQSSEEAGFWCEVGNSFKVKEGDVIHVISNTNLNFLSNSNLQVTHQEQDISVAVSNVTPQYEDADSMVKVRGANGTDSNNSVIRRFSSLEDNIGTAITYQDSATEGASFTVNETGVYHITYFHAFISVADFGITVNAADVSQGIGAAVNANSRLAMGRNVAGDVPEEVSWSGILQAGDVVRAHSDGGTDSTLTNRTLFTIAKVGLPSIAEVDVTPFVNLDQYRTEYISVRAEGNNGESITGGVTNIPFNLVEDSAGAWNGSEYTVQKDDSVLNIKMGVDKTSTPNNALIFIHKNGVEYRVIEYERNSTGVDQVTGDYVSYRGEFAAGDVVSFVINQNCTLQDVGNFHYLNIVEEYEEEGRSKFHSIAQTENEFSARIANDGTASIVSESQNFIDSVVRESAGVVRVNFVSGLFTETPAVQATVSAELGTTYTGTRAADYFDLDTTGVRIATKFSDASSNNVLDYDFELLVSRQGADRKDLQNAIVQLSDMPRVNRTLKQSLTYTEEQSIFRDLTNEVRFSASLTTSNFNGDSILKVVDDSANSRTQFVANRKCTVSVNFAGVHSGAGFSNIYKNGVRVIRGTDCYTGTATSHVGGTVSLQAGEFISVGFEGAGNGTGPAYLVINAEAQELERTFKAEIDSDYVYCPFDDFFWDGSGDQYTFDISLVNGYSADLETFEFVDNFVNAGGFATATILRAKQDIELHVQIGGRPNSSFLIVYNSAGESLAHGGAANQPEGASTSIKLAKDDYIFFRSVNNSTQAGFISILAKPQITNVVVGLNPLKFQTKILSANVTSTQDIAELQFNNLTVGKTYRISGMTSIRGGAGGNLNELRFYSGAGGTGTAYGNVHTYDSSADIVVTGIGINFVFTADSTTLYSRAIATGGVGIQGDGSKVNQSTFVTLEEIPEAVETTDFS